MMQLDEPIQTPDSNGSVETRGHKARFRASNELHRGDRATVSLECIHKLRLLDLPISFILGRCHLVLYINLLERLCVVLRFEVPFEYKDLSEGR